MGFDMIEDEMSIKHHSGKDKSNNGATLDLSERKEVTTQISKTLLIFCTCLNS